MLRPFAALRLVLGRGRSADVDGGLDPPDLDLLKALQEPLGDVSRHAYKGRPVRDVDTADAVSGDASVVGERADQIRGPCAMAASHRDVELDFVSPFKIPWLAALRVKRSLESSLVAFLLGHRTLARAGPRRRLAVALGLGFERDPFAAGQHFERACGGLRDAPAALLHQLVEPHLPMDHAVT
jgi:hypothetical protein